MTRPRSGSAASAAARSPRTTARFTRLKERAGLLNRTARQTLAALTDPSSACSNAG